MRRLTIALTALLSLAATAASAQALSVATGQASRLTLSAPVRDIVVGDPQIADVSIVNERTLIVLGKQAGATTLLAFDAHGRALVDRSVVVSQTADDAVIVQRGATASTYACATRCSQLSGGASGAPASAAPSVSAATPTP